MGDSPKLNEDEQIVIFYEKSPSYRTVHISGAFGGPTPDKGSLFVSLFNERFPIPQQIVHSIQQVGDSTIELGPEISRQGKVGIIREVEVALMIDASAAIKIRDWLDRQIKENFEKLAESAEKAH